MATKQEPDRINSAHRDVVTLGIATAAIILFIGTGGSVLPSVVKVVLASGDGPDVMLVNALLLNIALIIFGWRRYTQLTLEIREREIAEELARQLSEIDPLTGCLNRRSMASATEETRTAANERGEGIAYAMIDVDNFKQINDMHGHTVGDQLLERMAERLRALLPVDTPLARLGGDEFAFVIPVDKAQQERVDDLVIRLFETVATPFKLSKLTLHATISIGVASEFTDRATSPDERDTGSLMHHADIAMYHAKKEGKNRFCWFEPSMENELRFRNQLEIGIRDGIERDEFLPFYEQQVDLETGELVGFEVLARWQSPDLGLVSPELFIPIAEEIGLINDLSDIVMRKAFADAREWDPSLSISVNISPMQMRDPWFAQKLLKTLIECDFPASRLEIEITESCLHDNISLVRSMITSLRNQGIRVSLDDFGTGYASLEQLQTLPFDRLKIDQSFIRDLADKSSSTTVVDAIIALGNGLGMPLTAEGIETQATADALKGKGGFKGQGYLYGRPECSEDVRKRLMAKGRLLAQASEKKRTRADALANEREDFADHQTDWRRTVTN
ncbi:bifunctional diguanylate cyclase/phosphodiesterase [Erythrobacter sp. YT30]|uniref:putative bifunctional diguanylate cyclase/phosphodiesterase n=1 Tax=Erythrobacter sp. YT30 TaxID=1735012 RepID=UPI0009EB3524|nr:EAL domain-containing protein [Erythrobacter sp. YT30]